MTKRDNRQPLWMPTRKITADRPGTDAGAAVIRRPTPPPARRAWLTLLLLAPLLTAVVAPGFGGGGAKHSPLTQAEKAWLAAHPIITMAPDPAYPPIEYFSSDGRYEGIAADYVNLVEQKLGIRFKIAHMGDWDEILEAARRREVDMFGAAAITPQRAAYMLFTDPFVKFPSVIIVRKKVTADLTLEKLTGMRVAVVSGYADHDHVVRNYPQLELDVVPTVETGLRTVFGLCNAALFRDSSGKALGICAVIRDMTERRLVEEELLRYREHLEELVRDRTSELAKANDQLQQEINEHRRTEHALLESERQLRFMSSLLLSSQEEERKRIARELHDSIGQSLAAIKFNAENVLEEMAQDQSRTGVKALEHIVPIVQHAGSTPDCGPPCWMISASSPPLAGFAGNFKKPIPASISSSKSILTRRKSPNP